MNSTTQISSQDPSQLSSHVHLSRHFRTYLRTYLAMAAAVFLRLFWISDMEYKGDEKGIVVLISDLFSRPYNALANPSGHAGISHSSGFFYFLKVLSLGIDSPLWIGASIAIFNALSIALPLWFLRNSKRATLSFALCACNITLVLGSRKIWTPDLLAAWSCFALGFFLRATHKTGKKVSPSPLNSRRNQILLVVSGLCLVLAGHMYLPGAFVGMLGTIIVTSYLGLNDRPFVKPWALGCALGWLTFVPYTYALLTQTHAFAGNGLFQYDPQISTILSTAATLPSATRVYLLYLKPVLEWMQAYANTPLMNLTVLWVVVESVTWTILFWACLMRIALRWKELIKDPMALLGLALLLGTPLALTILKLGSYLHYWLGAIPFACYLIGFASTLDDSKASKWLTRYAWACCGISVIATLLFQSLVHNMKGLPGEYGPSYQSQTSSTARLEN